jgi:uncharacterized repeat protein (TIGR01451 family)
MRLRKLIAGLTAAVAMALAAPAIAAAAADLSVANLGPITLAPGTDATYTITVSNAGDAAAASASLIDTLAGTTTFVSLSAPGGWSCTTPAIGAGGSVTCSHLSVAPAASAVFTLVVHVDPSATGSVVNTAMVSTASLDASPANDSATSTSTLDESADVGVTVTDAPDPATAGTDLTSTVIVTNNGPSYATSPGWSDTLPLGTAFVSLSSPGGWSCATPAVGANGTVSCSSASMPLTTAVFTLVTRVDDALPDGTQLTNTVTLTASSSDPALGNETASATTTVAAPPAPPTPPAPALTWMEAPSVFSLSRASGEPGSAVVIDGSGFAGTSEVLFGDARASFVVDGHRQITAVVPAGTRGTVVEVRVVNPWGTSRVSDRARFTYSEPGTPASAAGPNRRVVCKRMPSLVRRTLAQARAMLKHAGCHVPVRNRGKRKGRDARVRSQTPRAGAPLYEGARVTLRIR